MKKHTGFNRQCMRQKNTHWMCTASMLSRTSFDAHCVDSLFGERVAGEGALGKGVAQAASPTPVPASSVGSRRDLPCQLLLARAPLAPRVVLDLWRRVAYFSGSGYSQKELSIWSHSAQCAECDHVLGVLRVQADRPGKTTPSARE